MLRLADVRAEVASGVPLILGFGGGVNTMAALVLLRDFGLKPDLISFADTGGEKPETYAYFALASTWLKRNGFPPLTIVRNESPIAGHKSLEDNCLTNETLPSRAFGRSACALRWKVDPQDKFLTSWAPARASWDSGRKPIKVLGYDGGEERRASVAEDKRLRYWYPLFEFELDRDACAALIQAERLPVPPKSACFFCPSSTKAEVLELARTHPDLFARALKMEAVAAANTHHPLRDVRGLGRHWSWTELSRMSQIELDLQIDQPVESCLVCADGGAP